MSRPLQFPRALVSVFVLLLGGGCGNKETTPPSTPASIAVVAGNNQTGLAGQALAYPLEVRVTDNSGAGVAAVGVTWEVVAGGGSLPSNSTATDSHGFATNTFSLGPVSGMQIVSVTVTAFPSLSARFTATARMPVVIQRYDGTTWRPEFGDSNGAFIRLSAVWGSSASDVFAVGGYGNYCGSAILHYDGTGWTGRPSCGLNYLDALSSVWGTSGTDIFTVGWSALPPWWNTYVSHYDGQQWSTIYSHECVGCFARLWAVWSTSATDAYIVGESGIIVYYDGSNSRQQVSGTTQPLVSVWGSSAKDIFAVGASGTILHYDGTAWQTQNSGTTQWLNGLWGTSATDVFAVGDGGTILHYDGATWTAQSSGTGVALNGVWGTSHNDVFAVGVGSTILHFDGTTWTAQPSGAPISFFGVWGTSSTNVIAVGAAR